MSNLGTYQTLVEAAKAVGGPEAFVDMLVKKGVKAGVISQRPVIIGAGLIGVMIGGAFMYYTLETRTLRADGILSQDPELDAIKKELKNTISDEDDNLTVAEIGGDTDKENKTVRVDELDELADKYSAIGEKLRIYDEDLLEYISGFDISDEDEAVKNFVMEYPGYEQFADKYRSLMPYAEDIAIVKSFMRSKSAVGEEGEDEFQS